jgi:hypothetical protein
MRQWLHGNDKVSKAHGGVADVADGGFTRRQEE